MANGSPHDRSGFGKVLQRQKTGQGVETSTADHGTKNKNLKSGDETKLPSFPGDFELLKLTLTSPNLKGNRPYRDLKAAWSALNIYEDLFSNSLTGTIQIIDGIGLMESVPIIGEETINIHVRTKGIKRERNSNEQELEGPFKGSESEGIITLKLKVTKIANIQKLNEEQKLKDEKIDTSEDEINRRRKNLRTNSLNVEAFVPTGKKRVLIEALDFDWLFFDNNISEFLKLLNNKQLNKSILFK